MTHIGRGVCVCVGTRRGLTSSAFALYDKCGSDKLSNVIIDAVQALTFFSSLFNRDLKIENLLLDEQDNIKLIGNTRAPTFRVFNLNITLFPFLVQRKAVAVA